MSDTGQRNVLGDELQVCGTEPMTGFFRDGYTTTSPADHGSHTVCAVGFPGLQPGDHWAVCAGRWLQSYEAGVKAPVMVRATNEAALEHVPLEALQECAADAPDDLGELLG